METLVFCFLSFVAGGAVTAWLFSGEVIPATRPGEREDRIRRGLAPVTKQARAEAFWINSAD